VEPVVHRRADDHHRLAVGLFSVAGEATGDGDNLILRHRRDGLSPSGRIGLHVVVIGRHMVAAEALIDEMMARYDATDRQQLRNLCRNIINARVDREAPAAKQDKYRRERKKLSDYLNSLEKNQLL